MKVHVIRVGREVRLAIMESIDQRLRSLPNKSKIAFSELGCFPSRTNGIVFVLFVSFSFQCLQVHYILGFGTLDGRRHE